MGLYDMGVPAVDLVKPLHVMAIVMKQLEKAFSWSV